MQRLLEKLFHTYYKDIYRYLYSLSHEVSLSEDLASEVFLEVVKSVASFRGESDIKTWMFSIARHKWCDYLRKKHRQIETETLTEFIGGEEKGPDERYLDRELLERIKVLLQEEPERTRNVVQMRMEGFSFYEIGKKQGISESSARVIYFRVKQKIKQTLEKEGWTGE
ncbi:MAG: RNA polymerase sigma factor [Lachnospiraceae bacterium]|nr:RNA polymerase sigma factor [Lachnospiraceae bacterium]MBP3611540.1 RNA polymerase sigma factor [Lachnospiraceae bacterium]